ncbi:ABC transporter substrate-binding protein [Dankookia rubra]|uniref:ABC transporter substrate-binding protein n=1 Tax=Dankookia rubra TaxID=1442381 RepID=A0A4R5Q851_9PROT|nr:ABC transporter substrate-binding protein [Dankookia rubra]TDH59114.1 ABC transporter substrate-binding protein [Dankookia rubra]
MKRRDFMALAGMVSAVPSAAGHAQVPRLPVIGYLCPESPRLFGSRIRAFRDGLAETGYVEGRNVAIEFRWAEGYYDRLPALAADLANHQVTAIVAPGGAPVALAAKVATSTIPIVFEMGGDPVALGVVGSLNRPEGNLTGVSSLSVEASLKRLELLHEVAQNAAVVSVVVNPTSPTADAQLKKLQIAAATLGLQLPVLQASTEPHFESVFAAVPQLHASGLVFTSDPFFAFRSQQLAELAIHHAVPAITQSRDFPIGGGLMSYGGDFVQSHRQAGVYAGRVLKGERPADLPVQRVTKLELFINLKIAKSLGIAVPLSLLARADEVIE